MTDQTSPFEKFFGKIDQASIDPLTGLPSPLAKQLMTLPRDMSPYEADHGVNSLLEEATDLALGAGRNPSARNP